MDKSIFPRRHAAPAPIRSLLAAGVLFLASCSALYGPHGTYTPAEACRKAADLDGRIVTVHGRIEIVSSVCTLEGCPPGNPCCNGCFHQLGFRVDDHRILSLLGRDAGCSGNSCLDACPFIDPSATYEVAGRFSWDGGSGCSLEMEQWGRID